METADNKTYDLVPPTQVCLTLKRGWQNELDRVSASQIAPDIEPRVDLFAFEVIYDL